jgi:hypothetical protein
MRRSEQTGFFGAVSVGIGRTRKRLIKIQQQAQAKATRAKPARSREKRNGDKKNAENKSDRSFAL